MIAAQPHPFELDELRQIEASFCAAIREGLARDGAEIRALPAFVAPPKPGLVGRALVLDTGGTNMRAALVGFSSKGELEIVGPVSRSLREAEAATLESKAFFDLHAELAEKVGATPDLPVGYCFSYPFEAQADGDARLIRWTKGIKIQNVEGQLVGAGLEAALARRGLRPRRVSVLNDTVAALLGGAARAADASGRHIGLIVGTGTNMASFFDAKTAPKLAPLGLGTMAVNLESGNFSPPLLSPLDEQLATRAEPRGAQRFEKAVSGLYLPELYALARPEARPWASQAGARGLVERAMTDGDPADRLARDLLLRSAQLVATGLSAVATIHGSDAPMKVLAEGSLFWSWTGYRAELDRCLLALQPQIRFEISQMENANLIGAASAALSRG